MSAPLVGIGGWCAGGRMRCVRGGSAVGPAGSPLVAGSAAVAWWGAVALPLCLRCDPLRACVW